MQETLVPSLGQEDPLEKGTATHSSILAWRIPWTEEPGRLLATGSQKMSDTTERLKQQQILFRLQDNYSHLVLLLYLWGRIGSGTIKRTLAWTQSGLPLTGYVTLGMASLTPGLQEGLKT